MRPGRLLTRVSTALLLGLLFQTVAPAQVYSIDWYRIAGGGGTSTDGFYAVTGTLGQSEAGVTMDDGIFSLTGGAQFESAGSDLPPIPLRIVRLTPFVNPGGVREVHIAMVGTPGHAFQLQFISELAPTILWADLGVHVLASDQGIIDFVDPDPPGVRFYRVIESAGQ